MDYQRLLLEHLALIDQIVRTTGRRRHLSREQEDFAGYVRLRLIEDDYAVLRKFQGRSKLRTYLIAVIERLSLDYRVERWGRWRPSAAAERLGPVAILLERLTHRDGHTLEEALEMITIDRAEATSAAELREIWAQLPSRLTTSEVAEEAAATVSSDQTAEQNIEHAERRASMARLERALKAALDDTPDQDRVMLALRYGQGLPIAEIASLTGISVPTLHRRLDRTIKELKRALTAAGVDPREISGLIGQSSMTLSPLLRAEVERFLGPVRLTKQDG